jgi:DNA repair ATPase RecN
LDAFGSLEESQLRARQQASPSYQELLRQRALDPQNERKLDKIRTQYHFVQSRIREVDFQLDSEWEQHQQRKNRQKMKTPATQNIYQTLSTNQRILHQQTRNLQHLTQALKQLKLHNTSVTWSDNTLNWQPYSPRYGVRLWYSKIQI